MSRQKAQGAMGYQDPQLIESLWSPIEAANKRRKGLGRLPSRRDEATVAALFAMQAWLDPATAEHERHTAMLVAGVGSVLGLGDGRLTATYQASLIHDIGKSLPAIQTLVVQQGRLSKEEFTLVKDHPMRGYELLMRSLECPLPLALPVRDHHEWLNGRGYPRAKAGEALDLETRIVTVCDVFEALTASRPYRQAQPIDAALEVLLKGRGRLYDAQVVDALYSFIAKARLQAKRYDECA